MNTTTLMKLLLLLSFLLVSIPLSAQERMSIEQVKTELDSIKSSKINSACACSDGMEKIASVLINASDSFSTKTEMENDAYGMIIINLTTNKTIEVSEQCLKLGLNDSDIFECSSFKSLEEKSKILNKKFRN
jgi:hypothetical protein